MLPLFSASFILTLVFLYKFLNFLPFFVNILNWIGLFIVYLCSSWILAKLIHNYISSKLLGPLPTTGKAVLITGCDSGFGHGAALQLNKSGFRVFAGCLFPDGKGAKSLKSSASNRDKIHIIKLDVTKDEDIETTVNLISEHLNKSGETLWGIVNNAGVGRVGKIEWGSFDNHFRQLFDVNVFGVVKVTRAMLPLLRSSSGRVVTISSINSNMTFPNTGAYSMTKAALTPFQDALRAEIEKFGVKVISIEPSFSSTPIIDQKSVDKLYSDLYDNSPKEIKEIYYEDKMMENLRQLLAIPCRYLSPEATYDKVINNIVKSLTDYEPSYCMPATPPVMSFVYTIYPSFPPELKNLIGKILMRLSRSLNLD
ncbi:retinol dehydrogenase 2 [Tetranychus urticae]|uniref:Uncharacterized protein n=1 Tax=Tetranychus urticae TaxID=32264 RepID=T1KVI0_TETUR|nr:retinol dehydrogenase 2 [Tetranychus urticae]